MPLEVKQFNCPTCGSPLELKNAARSKSIVCPSCGSQIDLTSPAYPVIGRVSRRPEPNLTPFKIGMQGTMEGEQHQVIGRVRYRDDESETWDEWLLLTAGGDYRWISDDEDEGMVLWHSFTPSKPLDPATVSQGQTIDLGDGAARVRERDRAAIDYLEGELTWKAAVGETVEYLDAQAGGLMYSIEWTANEIEFWRGKRLNRDEIAKAFGITSARVGAAVSAGGARGVTTGAILVGLIVCFLLMCVGVAVAGGTSSQSQGEELVCITPSAQGLAGLGTPTPQSLSSAALTATPPPNCYYRPRSSGSGFFLFPSGPSIRSGSSGGRSFSGSGK